MPKAEQERQIEQAVVKQGKQVDPMAALLPVLARLESGQAQRQEQFDHQPKEQERSRAQLAESALRFEQPVRLAERQELYLVHYR